MSKEIKPGVDDLSRQLKDVDGQVRESAAIALREIGKPAVPALIEALEDGDEDVRMRAALALVSIGVPTVPALIEALKDKNSSVRRGAALALRMIGDVAAVPALIEALKDEDVRWSATLALGKIGPRNHKDLLLVHSLAREARKEGKPTDRFLELYTKWSNQLRVGADGFVSKSRTLPKPKLRKPDSVKRVKLRRVVG